MLTTTTAMWVSNSWLDRIEVSLDGLEVGWEEKGIIFGKAAF
jgi:hypothetical protein